MNDEDEQSLEGVSVTIKRVLLAVSHGNISVQAASQQETKGGHDGVNVRANDGSPSLQTVTDEDGYYEFSGLAKGSYTLTYEKDGYQTKTKSITLEEGEEKDIGTPVLEEGESKEIEIEMRKTSKRIKGLLLEDDVQ